MSSTRGSGRRPDRRSSSMWRDALGRMVRVERHIGAAGREHRVHGDDQVDRAAHAERHQRFRADAVAISSAGEAVHLGGELGVASAIRPSNAHGGRVRGALRPARRTVETSVVRWSTGCAVAFQPVTSWCAFAAVEQVDVADTTVGIGGHRDPASAAKRVPRAATVARRTGRSRTSNGRQPQCRRHGLAQGEVQVELGGVGVDLESATVRPAQFERRFGELFWKSASPGTAGAAPVERAGLSTSTSRSNGTSAWAKAAQVALADACEQFGEGGAGRRRCAAPAC